VTAEHQAHGGSVSVGTGAASLRGGAEVADTALGRALNMNHNRIVRLGYGKMKGYSGAEIPRLSFGNTTPGTKLAALAHWDVRWFGF
jgi:hypothetical protein